MNVFVYRDLGAEIVEALRQEFPHAQFRQSINPKDLEAALNWAEVLFGNPPAQQIKGSPTLRWLQIVSSGFDEYAALRGHRIAVTTAHGVHAPIIAQHALTMILWFARGQPHLAQRQREHAWDRRPSIPTDLADQTVGLVGYGDVGRALARMLQPIGPTVVAAKRNPIATPPELDAIYGFDQLDALVAASDHVVIALPLTPQTRGIFGAARLAQCKRGANLYNVARGELLDEDALLVRLRDGSLGGAALDVFGTEPLPAVSPFWDLPNVVVTPHLAGHHRALGRGTLERFKANLRRYFAGEPLEHVADFERGY
jgi:phosphoglycerate dehydrogenase-like enzyme